MEGPRGSPRPSASRDATSVHGTKGRRKVLVPSSRGAAGPGAGIDGGRGRPPGPSLCSGAGGARSRVAHGCVEIRSLSPAIGSFRRGASPCRRPGAALVPGLSRMGARGRAPWLCPARRGDPLQTRGCPSQPSAAPGGWVLAQTGTGGWGSLRVQPEPSRQALLSE